MPPQTRRDDCETSIAAANAILEHLPDLQAKVLHAFRQHGPMTDGQLERLPRFSNCAGTTVRKRRQELMVKGLVRWTGRKIGRFRVWEEVPSEEIDQRTEREKRESLF